MAGNSSNAGSSENPQGSFNTEVQNVTEITLNQVDQTKEIDETVSVIATVAPDNASNKKVDWTSSDSNVATLSTTQTSSGTAVTVTCKNPGTTTITAMAADGSGVSKSFELTVKNPLTAVELDKTSIEILRNMTETITAITTPSNASANLLTWTTSNPEVASISTNGKEITVTGNKSGTVTITAQAVGNENIKAECTITVGVINFSYTGTVENVTIPAGIYKLECWGAQGGNDGGKGGYATGILKLQEKTVGYFRIGGSGVKGAGAGGFNGGGKGTGYGSGGGATDIRINVDSLFSRVIVAGGGRRSV